MLLRFYDVPKPDNGAIFLNDVDIRSIAPVWIRRHVGMVEQEPHLFNVSLRDNIAYGDNSRTVPYEEIVEAARQANVHDFIASLPQVCVCVADRLLE